MAPVVTGSRARTIVTADPELDGLNSLLRILLYTNEIDLQGLVYASSRYHWRGDDKGTEFFLPDREYDSPQTSWRWAPGERFIHDAVDAYAEVHPNLVVHDRRYPPPDALRAIIRYGNVDFEGDMSADTPGSDLIADALLDDDPRPIHIQLWAGPATVARALKRIEDRYSGDENWARIRASVSTKAIITKFASQDATYDEYIRPVWPDIRVTDVAADAWGYGIRNTLRHPDRELISARWMRQHVTSVGPLGALYRVWGDGRQMVPGDPTDYFGISGRSSEQLRAHGFQVWTDPRPAGEWISEGDSTNMLNLIAPGLRGAEHPSFGGWGGRAVRTDVGLDTWAIAEVADASAGGEPESALTRWFGVAQLDFAARLRWTVTPRFGDAAHHPRLETGPDRDVSPGEKVALTARATDPDTAAPAEVRWWLYEEAGTCPGAVLAHQRGGKAVVGIPADAAPGATVHAVAEAHTALAAWRRVILTVR